MTAPTFPAMSDDDIKRAISSKADELLDHIYEHGTMSEGIRPRFVDIARAIIAARDAQWAARHNAWVDGINKAMAAEVDKLQEEVENLHSVMVAAAEEIHEHWQAHCDEDGYGPANLMHRLEKGIPAQYAYKAGDFERLMQERDAAVARLDAAVRAAPVAPTEPTHLRRADGTLSGVFVEPVASEAIAVAADLRNWLDFLPGHAQPTIEQAVRLLETKP